ncbi:hypothetical protein PQX77_018296 [Marasmius sp. AFHP31]|nr:hypothetical protein PQX77_018296 [Marasmius sp. AFHP31]
MPAPTSTSSSKTPMSPTTSENTRGSTSYGIPISPSGTPTASGGGTLDNKELRIIIGVVIGGVAFIILLIVLFICLRRKGRKEHPGKFRRDMMVLERVDTNGGSKSLRRDSTPGRTERGRHLELDPISSTTPLQADFEGGQDKRSSFTGSVYSRASAGTQTLAALSISHKSEGHSEEASEIRIPPLIPIPSSSYPPPSPLHLRTPSRARTDRQMQIEQKIIELQGRFITASGSGQEKVRTRAELKDRIERVKELRESAWAYGGKGDVPDDLID